MPSTDAVVVAAGGGGGGGGVDVGGQAITTASCVKKSRVNQAISI